MEEFPEGGVARHPSNPRVGENNHARQVANPILSLSDSPGRSVQAHCHLLFVRSFEFRAEPHTDLEPGTAVIHVAPAGSVADPFFGASSVELDCLLRESSSETTVNAEGLGGPG